MPNSEITPESVLDPDLTFFTPRPATPREAAERRCDGLPVRDARLADLSPALVRWFVPEWAEEPEPAGAFFLSHDLLRKLGLAVGDPPRPTVAGILMATDDSRRFLPHAWTRCAIEPDDGVGTPSEILIIGPLARQVLRAFDLVRKYAAPGTYAPAAVFEVLVNAVAHRDYAVQAPIELRILSNRLDLIVPGALYGSMTVEAIPWRMATRNPILTSLLAKCQAPDGLFSTVTADAAEPTDPTDPVHSSYRPMMRRVGEGARFIKTATEALAGQKPTWAMTTISTSTPPDTPALRLTIPVA